MVRISTYNVIFFSNKPQNGFFFFYCSPLKEELYAGPMLRSEDWTQLSHGC